MKKAILIPLQPQEITTVMEYMGKKPKYLPHNEKFVPIMGGIF